MLDNLRINIYGLIAFSLIMGMIIIRMAQITIPPDTVTNPIIYRMGIAIFDPYVLGAILPYTIISFITVNRLNSKDFVQQRLSKRKKLRYQRIYIGTQVAFVLLIIGLLLGVSGLIWKSIYYIAAVMIGFLMAFFLVSLEEEELISQETDDLEF